MDRDSHPSSKCKRGKTRIVQGESLMMSRPPLPASICAQRDASRCLPASGDCARLGCTARFHSRASVIQVSHAFEALGEQACLSPSHLKFAMYSSSRQGTTAYPERRLSCNTDFCTCALKPSNRRLEVRPPLLQSDLRFPAGELDALAA